MFSLEKRELEKDMIAVCRYLKVYYVTEGTNLFLVLIQYDLKYGFCRKADFTSVKECLCLRCSRTIRLSCQVRDSLSLDFLPTAAG